VGQWRYCPASGPSPGLRSSFRPLLEWMQPVRSSCCRDLLRRDVWRLDDIDPDEHPGESASVITCIDGYQMTRKDEGGGAIYRSMGLVDWRHIEHCGPHVLGAHFGQFAVKFVLRRCFLVLLIAFFLLGSLGKAPFSKPCHDLLGC